MPCMLINKLLIIVKNKKCKFWENKYSWEINIM